MESLGLLLPLVLMLVAARLAGLAARRVGLPSVVGELTAGLVLGPSVLNMIHPGETITSIADLGVIILMFIAGLETDLVQMRRVGRAATLTAACGVIVPFAAGMGIGLAVGLGVPGSLFLGTVLTATSVSVSVQVLGETGSLRSRIGTVILGAAVLDDVLGILVLSVVLSFIGQGQSVVVTLLRLILFFPVGIVLGRFVISPLLQRLAAQHAREAAMALVIAVVLLYSWSAEALGGLAAITGAYLAGIMIARLPENEWIAQGAQTVGQSLFVPVFFVSVGLHTNLRDVAAAPAFALVLTLAAVLSKAVGAGLGARFSGCTWFEGKAIGAGMIARGEVALVMATLGLSGGLLDSATFTVVVLMTVTTTLVAPLLLKATLGAPKEESAQRSKPYAGAPTVAGLEPVGMKADY